LSWQQCQGHSIGKREPARAIASITIIFNWKFPGVKTKFKRAGLSLSLLGEVNDPQVRALVLSKQISDFLTIEANWL
jgi:hypothetical protein